MGRFRGVELRVKSRERVLEALGLEEPDRVPLTEVDVEVPIMEEVLGETFPAATSLQTQVLADRRLEKKRTEFKVEFSRKVGFDLLILDLSAPEGWIPRTMPGDLMVDLWGRVLKLDRKAKAWVPYATVFNTPEDVEAFQIPDPEAYGWTFSMELGVEMVDGDVAVAGFIRDPFALAWEMLTPMKFVLWMHRERGVIEGLLERLTEFNVEVIKRIGEVGVDFIVSGGDYCEEKGPMVPVGFFRERVFPMLARQVNAAHSRGLLFVKHTDGNIMPILEDLAGLVDGLHSLDPSAGVDIAQVKSKHGDELVLMGNVAVDSLARKSVAEVVEETRMCIEKASPGGGHILSSSNSWAGGAKLANCLAMVEAGKKYGSYPKTLKGG